MRARDASDAHDATDATDGRGGGDARSTPDSGVDGGRNDASDDGAGVTGCSGSVALTYDTTTDRAPHVASPPTLGPAGTLYKDPTYGTSVLRVTDAMTLPGSLSYRVANEFWGNDWSTDAKLFYLQDSSGAVLPYAFDPKTLVATRVADKTMPGSPLKMPLSSGGFSRTEPTILYGMKALTVAEFDFSTQTTTDLVDLTTVVPGATGNALGVQQAESGLLASVFGGPEQDKMPYLVTWDPVSKTPHVLDVTQSTLDGKPIGTTIGGGLHAFKLDVSGRYLAFEVNGGSSTDWVWDTTAGAVTTLPSLDTVGSAAWASKLSSASYAWDLQTFASPTMAVSLITPAAPVDTMASATLEWKNATPGALSPLIVETMRQPGDTTPWQAWDEEIIAVRTDGMLVPGEAGTPETEVWRFAHTFNTYTGTMFSDNYYYLFIPRVSQNGWFVLFDSNWNGSLGTDNNAQPRTDAFIVALPNPCGP
jgi:hypothetical protein